MLIVNAQKHKNVPIFNRFLFSYLTLLACIPTSNFSVMYILNTLFNALWRVTQPTFTCSKLTIETLEQGVKYVQS